VLSSESECDLFSWDLIRRHWHRLPGSGPNACKFDVHTLCSYLTVQHQQGNLLVTIDGITEKSDSLDLGVVFAKGGLAPGPHFLDMHYSPNSEPLQLGGLPDAFTFKTVNILMGDGDTT
jgi:hypothetical protein